MRHAQRWPVLSLALLLGSGLAMARERPRDTVPPPTPEVLAQGKTLFAQHCAQCHGERRLGAIGPALIPESLARSSLDGVAESIRNGLPATQMPAFGEQLSRDEISALAQLLFQPPEGSLSWEMAEIAASRVRYGADPTANDAFAHQADPLNLFTVVEAGDHHVSILDGDRFEVLDRFKSRHALHGGAKYSPDGRYLFLASRDGWVSCYDLRTLRMVAEVRAGLHTRNLAISSDGRYLAVGNTLPHTLVILDATTLAPLRVIPVVGDGQVSSRVSAVYNAPPRQSFIVALKDLPEVWEIPYNDNPRPVYPGLVHSHEAGMVEALGVQRGPFSVRRIRLDDYLDDFFFDASYQHLMGAARNARKGQVVNLIVGRRIADLDLSGLPHLGSGISWNRGGMEVMATPHMTEAAVSVIDMSNWKTLQRIPTQGPGFFMRSHARSRYAWVDAFNGRERDVLQVIDKDSLEIVRTLRPAPGKPTAHVEFTRDGRYALASIWDRDGALVVYDAVTLEEVKRIPMNKPVGKYNVYNKITYDEGTSH
ncbi:MAG: nitrite reductase [Magnetococcus sp. WYHC-3]